CPCQQFLNRDLIPSRVKFRGGLKEQVFGQEPIDGLRLPRRGLGLLLGGLSSLDQPRLLLLCGYSALPGSFFAKEKPIGNRQPRPAPHKRPPSSPAANASLFRRAILCKR